MLIQKPLLFVLVALQVAFIPQNSKQELNDQMFEAVRQGDAAKVTALLDQGADVNAKFRYGMTALFKAAEKGNPDVVKVLLDRGVDASVKDTFYGATAMSWAISNKHFAVVKLILEKMPTAVDDVMLNGASESNAELVNAAIARGGAKPETMTVALVAVSRDPKNAALVEALKKAGAQPPPAVSEATLQSYTGKYRGDPGPEISIALKDGKFVAISPNRQFDLMALSETNFRPVDIGGMTLTFNVEGGKVASITMKQGPNTTQLKRVEETKQP